MYQKGFYIVFYKVFLYKIFILQRFLYYFDCVLYLVVLQYCRWKVTYFKLVWSFSERVFD